MAADTESETEVGEVLLKTSCQSRGVTRLDGARGKKQVWRPHVWT